MDVSDLERAALAGNATRLGLVPTRLSALVARARMVSAQRPEVRCDRVRKGRVRAGVFVHLALEGAEGILLGASRVDPALEGLGAEVNGLFGGRVSPPFRCELGDVRAEVA